jgi:hypothetical protein
MTEIETTMLPMAELCTAQVIGCEVVVKLRGRRAAGAYRMRPFSPECVRKGSSAFGGWESFAAALLEAVAVAFISKM